MSTASPGFYVTGGTLRPDAPSYVERQADRDLYDGLSGGDFCYVLTARQMGKSSLMARTAHRLRQEGVTVVVLDLTAIGQNLSPEQWYDGLRWLLGQQLDLDEALDEFWLAHERLGPLQRWLAALQQVVLARVPCPLVIFVEEVDTVLSLPFSTDEFFAGIRECYNRRVRGPEFHRLTFCLLGVASPTDLIQDTRTTPFNIGRRIELTDFTEAEAAPLARGPGPAGEQGGALLKRVLYWTGGHPYLTQRLCQAVAEDAGKGDPVSVDRLCEQLYLSHRARERDDNLLFVRDRLLRGEADVASLLGLYARVRGGLERVADDETNLLVSALRLSGIVREGSGCLKVRNRIYARVFDRAWVEANLPDAELRRLRAVAREETRKRRQAEEREQVLRRLLYGAQMSLAYQAWDAGDLQGTVRLLEAQRPGQGQEDLRGFEWRHLWRLCRVDAWLIWDGHAESVSVTFSPDGRTLAATSGEPRVRLWDIGSQRELPALQSSSGRCHSQTFSPDGHLLASWISDNAVQLWDLRTRREWATFSFPGFGDTALTFSPDGRILAAGSAAGLKVWDLGSRQEIAGIQGQNLLFRALAFSPRASRFGRVRRILASGDGKSGVRLWDAASGQELAAFQGHTAQVTCVAFAPDGEILASASDDGTLRLWRLDPRSRGRDAFIPSETLRGHRSVVYSVAFSPDGKTLASASDDLTIKLWDLARREIRNTLKGHRATVYSVSFSSDGQTLASGSMDRTVRLWDTGEQDSDVLEGHTDVVNAVAFSPDSRLLASGSNDDTIKLWDLASRREVAVLPVRSGWWRRFLAFSPDGETLASGTSDRTVELWNVASGRRETALAGHEAPVRGVAFSPDGRILASTSEDMTVKLWNIAARREVTTLRGHPSRLLGVAFSPDGTTLATCGGERSVRIWDADTGEEVAVLDGHQGMVFVVAFSPNGRTLATCSWDHSVKLWDLASKTEIATLQGHAGIVDALAFSPDGRTLATAGADHVIRLWDVRMKQAVGTLIGHRASVWTLAFSPDGNTLASGGPDATVRLWRAASFAETDATVGAPRSRPRR